MCKCVQLTQSYWNPPFLCVVCLHMGKNCRILAKNLQRVKSISLSPKLTHSGQLHLTRTVNLITRTHFKKKSYTTKYQSSSDYQFQEISRPKKRGHEFNLCNHGPNLLTKSSPFHMSSLSTPSSPTLSSQILNQNSPSAAVAVAEKLRDMALVPNPAVNDGPLFAEVDMGADASATTVRATVVQAATVFYDTPATLDKAERLLAEAASYGSQLVVFPEAFIGGYPRGSNFGVTIGNRTAKGKEEFRKYHAAAIDVPGPEVDRLAAMAGKYKVYLVMGVIERDGYTLYCTVLFFDSQGRFLGKHRKVMPTALERLIWGFGDGSTIPVFETPIGKIGAAICWENRMPLLRTAMYAKGIEIYCAPTADSREVWQASMTHIALEGGCFVLSANQFCRRKDYPPPPDYVFSGTEEELVPESVVCAGGSVIISPSGTVLAGPNYDGEALISADLDLGEVVRAKFDFDVVGHYARPEILSLVVKDHPMSPVSFTSASGKADVA